MAEDKFNLKDSQSLFFVEGREMLDQMEQALLELEKDFKDEEAINSLFRSIHTIKGASGMFGFDEIESFTHHVEHVLDRARSKKIEVDSALINILLNCHDFILYLLNFCEAHPGDEIDESEKDLKAELLDLLDNYSHDSETPESEDRDGGESDEADHEQDDEAQEESDPDDIVSNACWHISLRLGENVFKNGLDPRSFISYLNELGTIERITPVYDELQTVIDDFDPEKCYLGFEIDFYGNVTKEKIWGVFEFLSDDCSVKILPPGSAISDYVELIEELPETSMRIGEILKKIGSLTELELEKALDLQMKGIEPGDNIEKKLLGDIVVEEKMVQKQVVDAALEKQKVTKSGEESRRRLIRIDAEKLDNLINLVGELVITGSNVKQLSDRTGETDLVESVSVMTRLIEDIRDSTMNVRMVQIGETFRRYNRIVRDLSSEQGKEIELRIAGGETELDKTLIERISDPLIHLIRNSVDHGIDRPEVREKAGKRRIGVIYLNAYHETGSVVIEISDDGNGLNREKIYQKALERQLIQPGQNISDEDLYQLIFEPGFSTAERITNISGRGVGMDVVRRNIESLRGTIIIESKEMKGTTIRIHLPLTLAIIDGFMVTVGESHFVMPLDLVVECAEITNEDLNAHESGNFINLRGEVLPFLRLRDFFDQEGDKAKENIVVFEYARQKAGLVVDELIGEFQTVIKPLGRIFDRLQWISGATILGSGEVAFILDAPRMIQHIKQVEGKVRSSVNEDISREQVR